MPTRIKNEIVDIPLNGGLVKGILNGDENNWSFQSLNRSFLALFAEGIVHSYTYLGVDTRNYEHHRFQLAIAARAHEILDQRRELAKLPPVNQKIMPAVRRYVVP
jgi:hypothetical protein